jgi:hypothetical protein
MKSNILRNMTPCSQLKYKFTNDSEELNVSTFCKEMALLLVPFYLLAFAFRSTIKMEVVYSSETSIKF